MKEKLEYLIDTLKYLLKESTEAYRISLAGDYDEAYHSGECNAYEIALEMLENIIKGD